MIIKYLEILINKILNTRNVLFFITLLFVGLKIGGVINWQWCCVLSPIILLLGIFILRVAHILIKGK